MATFYTGQKIVCVDACPGPSGFFWCREEEIFEGNIYTVRRCFVDCNGNEVVWLDEVARSLLSQEVVCHDCGYGVRRFRPLRECKTDISIFTAMLNDQRALEPV